jgi:periplasmic copper chaperone A
MHPLRPLLPAVLLSIALLAGCESRPAVRVENAWVRAADSAGTTAAYLTVVNDGPDTLRLTGVTGTCADAVQMHETVREGGMVSMREAAEFVVAPHAKAAFEPGGSHIMLVGLRQKLTPGLWVNLALHTSAGAELPVTAGVRQ